MSSSLLITVRGMLAISAGVLQHVFAPPIGFRCRTIHLEARDCECSIDPVALYGPNLKRQLIVKLLGSMWSMCLLNSSIQVSQPLFPRADRVLRRIGCCSLLEALAVPSLRCRDLLVTYMKALRHYILKSTTDIVATCGIQKRRNR